MTEVLSPNAEKIMKLKYSQEKSNGELESWEEVVTRVARYVASAEEDENNELVLMGRFIKMMYQRDFLPGGRVLANAGTEIKNMMNCFVLPVEDSREGIYKSLKHAAEVFAHGGGIGYNFSNLRERGSEVEGTGGSASGPISFMDLFNQTGEVISQASRRGAQMGILNINHPDIIKFINFKNDLNPRNERIVEEFDRNLEYEHYDGIATTGDFNRMIKILSKTLADDQLTHFNISVGITDDFMEAVKNDDDWYFDSHDGEKIKSPLSAIELLELIAENAWKNGDPGLFFIDRANTDNLVVDYVGEIESTNPCGEVPLLPYEPCCLGSINLANMVEGDYIDWIYLESVIRNAVRFLDNVHILNETPVPEINKAARRTRRLGLGVMGLADMLAELGVPYNSEDSLKIVEDLAYFIGQKAWQASMDLAEERGSFLAYNEDKLNWSQIDKFDLDRRPPRNVAITSIAPTGTIALVSDVNGGIEPFFATNYTRNITEGVGNTAKDSITQEIELVVKAREDWSWDDDKIQRVFKTAHDINWKHHIKMQATWQEFIDNAVSKTINMDNDVSVEDVVDAYMMAWEEGCKGITVYRDGSKFFQILNR